MAPLFETLEFVFTNSVVHFVLATITTTLWFVWCYLAVLTIKRSRAYRDLFVDSYLREAADVDRAIGIYGVIDEVNIQTVDDVEVTREDVRDELIRDSTAIKLIVDDDTPEAVQRYLYLEAMHRAQMRKLKLLDDDDNDLFAAPRSQQRGHDQRDSRDEDFPSN